MKNVIISLIAISCLIQGCGDGKSSAGASKVVADDSTPPVAVSTKAVNESAVNAPALPGLSDPLPTENIKNLSN